MSAGDVAKFAAREFVAQWTRETGEKLAPLVSDRVLFAYEMGYLRGQTDAARDTLQMMSKTHEGEGDA